MRGSDSPRMIFVILLFFMFVFFFQFDNLSETNFFHKFKREPFPYVQTLYSVIMNIGINHCQKYFKVARTSFPRARARQTSYARGPTREESKTNVATVCFVRERLFSPL